MPLRGHVWPALQMDAVSASASAKPSSLAQVPPHLGNMPQFRKAPNKPQKLEVFYQVWGSAGGQNLIGSPTYGSDTGPYIPDQASYGLI